MKMGSPYGVYFIINIINVKQTTNIILRVLLIISKM